MARSWQDTHRQVAEQDVIRAARRLLDKISNMTSHDFSLGGEKAEREALESALASLDALP